MKYILIIHLFFLLLLPQICFSKELPPKEVFLRILHSDTQKQRERYTKVFLKCEQEAVNLMISELRYKDVEKTNLIFTLIPKFDDVAIEPLLKTLVDKDQYIVSIGISLLGILKTEKAFYSFILLLRDNNARIRANASRALGELKNDFAIPYLIEMLEDEDPVVRRNAIISLGKLKAKSSVSKLIECMRDPDFTISFSSINALSQIGGKELTDTLIYLSENSDGIFQHLVIQTLGEIRDTKAIPTLIKFLESSSPLERAFAVEALSNYRGNWRVANALKRNLNDMSPFVRTVVKESLIALKKEQITNYQ